MTQSSEETNNGRLVSTADLKDILEDSLPLDHIVHSFAYGSGVFMQQSDAKVNEKKVVDFIVVTRDSESFHRANLLKNPHHYAGPLLTAQNPVTAITWWQRHPVGLFGSYIQNPGVYFNVTDQDLKYGVVQTEDIRKDLQTWRFLYLAGRLHKPVVTVIDEDPMIQEYQQQVNLPAAVAASLLLLGESSLSATELFTEIAGLSYAGDPRIAAGAEDPQKVSKLVNSSGQRERFERLYGPAIQKYELQGVLSWNGTEIEWDMSSDRAHALLWDNIPLPVHCDVTNLKRTLISTVAAASRYQSAKGLVTAGFRRSAAYAIRKLSKGWKI